MIDLTKEDKNEESREHHKVEHNAHKEGQVHHTSHHTGHHNEHSQHHASEHRHIRINKSDPGSKLSPLWMILGIAVVAVALILGFNHFSKGNNGPLTDFSGNAVKVDFYVMSQCPYGTQVVDAIAPAVAQLGNAVDLSIDFIANDNGDGTFQSLHGQNEVLGNIVQLCAAKYEPQKYLEMITCQNKNAGAIPGNWEKCAQDAGLDVNSVKACYEGAEGKSLLSDSIKKSDIAGAQGSPTIFINGVPYNGGRKTSDFLRAICNEYGSSENKPEACSNIPEPTKVNLLVLNDARCKECVLTGLIGQIKSVFPGLVVQSLDYSDAEGKQKYDDLGLDRLPAILFDDTVKADEAYAQVEPYLTPMGEYLYLEIGADFNPKAEICDNGIDDTGNGMIDCKDPDCTGNLLCRAEKKNDLQVFIMSDCPYGRKAIEALKPVIENFEGKIKYDVHYIAGETAGGFNSLHGQYEVDEDIIQLCVKEHSPSAWFDYLYCRSINGVRGVDWKKCAAETNVDADAVQACFEGEEGASLLREDIKIAESLGVGGSPTWMANNKYMFSGIDSETVKANFCQYNPTVEGCENTLSSDTGNVPSGACG